MWEEYVALQRELCQDVLLTTYQNEVSGSFTSVWFQELFDPLVHCSLNRLNWVCATCKIFGHPENKSCYVTTYMANLWIMNVCWQFLFCVFQDPYKSGIISLDYDLLTSGGSSFSTGVVPPHPWICACFLQGTGWVRKKYPQLFKNQLKRIQTYYG